MQNVMLLLITLYGINSHLVSTVCMKFRDLMHLICILVDAIGDKVEILKKGFVKDWILIEI